jgi:peptidoglycan-associated lipoprotein
MVRYALWLLSGGILLGCAATVPSTKVVLLPDEDNKTGIVMVYSDTATIELSEPYSYVMVDDTTTVPVVMTTDPAVIKKETELLMKAEPEPTLHFILHFDHDSTNLTAQSRQLIPQILQALENRKHAEISIIGHTDTRGPARHNIELSLERAQEVERVIREYDKDLQHIGIQGFGEKDLLVPTADEVSEERNRRVEIMIR